MIGNRSGRERDGTERPGVQRPAGMAQPLQGLRNLQGLPEFPLLRLYISSLLLPEVLCDRRKRRGTLLPDNMHFYLRAPCVRSEASQGRCRDERHRQRIQ